MAFAVHEVSDLGMVLELVQRQLKFVQRFVQQQPKKPRGETMAAEQRMSVAVR